MLDHVNYRRHSYTYSKLQECRAKPTVKYSLQTRKRTRERTQRGKRGWKFSFCFLVIIIITTDF